MDHSRHAGIFDCSQISVTLIGSGGIGAFSALVLAKMGIGALTVYDDDVVSPENLATQLHALSDVGNLKVAALGATLSRFSDDTQLALVAERVTPATLLADEFVISAVDSIQARKDIWQAVRAGRVRYYLDARMAAEEFQLYFVDLEKDTAFYERMLSGEDDASVPELPCTAKATIYCAAISAGELGSAVRKVITGRPQPRVLVYNMRANSYTVIP